jgi:hypothetical protein
MIPMATRGEAAAAGFVRELYAATDCGSRLQQRPFQPHLTGDAGPDYAVQASTNLVTWQSLFTNHLPTPPFNWSDANAGDFTRRFYRIQLGP